MTAEPCLAPADAPPLPVKPVSADSHVTEPPNCYIDFIDPRYRDVAPRVEKDAQRGDVFVIDRLTGSIPMGLVAAAGVDPRSIRPEGTRFEDLHRGGWDPKARIAEQERDGVAAEIIYPSVGMVLCRHPDVDYQKACFDAYNRWLQQYCAAEPRRLFGIGQTAVRSVAEAVEDFRRIREMGFKGVMLPGDPGTEADYDDPSFDPLWRAAIALDLPISFHILTATQRLRDAQGKRVAGGAYDGTQQRGPRINGWMTVLRGVQDIIGMFIFGRVLERHPELKLVCVEGDAGWVPHYTYRMDHIYDRHRFWMKTESMSRRPSEQFFDQVYLTFQDDWTAFRVAEMCNVERLMWANDFPHSDSTWPHSEQLLLRHTAHLPDDRKRRILRDNVVGLYGLDVAA